MSNPSTAELYERLEASTSQMQRERVLLQTYRTALREVVNILAEQGGSLNARFALDVAESALEQGEAQ